MSHPENRIRIEKLKEMVGQEVTIAGFVDIRRDHGKLIFIDLRDESGKVQMIALPSHAEAHALAGTIRPEWVISVSGKVNKRPEKLVNKNEMNGEVELEMLSAEVISRAETPPFDVRSDGMDIGEEARLTYRYLDLRRPRLQKNLRLRAKVTSLIREYMGKNDFVEIETPMLTKTSPEGARDFLVPSRMQPGKFYALPQAPQQYKQLLMLSGFERYFQLARAMRDEDLRGDRQFEHTQIDLEMAFVKQRDVLDLVEGLMIYVAESVGKTVLKKPFPVFTHEEAMKQFGADKFDMRSEEEKKDPNIMAFAWVIDFPLLEWDDNNNHYTFAHNPFSAPRAEHVEKLMQISKEAAGKRSPELDALGAQQYDLVCNGYELASGGVRISDPKVQRKVFELMGLTPEQTEERFGHIIKAYEYGAPPHAGMAPGLDRLVMLLANEPNIREVIAFPMNASGGTSVMDAPSDARPEQLKELGIQIKK
ncbi:MAG: amino acid--tRNA ligase-related protein [bacterium]|nr:amino acid--tRNA ligase-related protein [bacterium]